MITQRVATVYMKPTSFNPMKELRRVDKAARELVKFTFGVSSDFDQVRMRAYGFWVDEKGDPIHTGMTGVRVIDYGRKWFTLYVEGKYVFALPDEYAGTEQQPTVEVGLHQVQG